MKHKKWVIYYLEELLNENQTGKFESHLNKCHVCRNYIKNYKSLNKIISKKTSEKVKTNSFDKAEFVSRITNLDKTKEKIKFNFMPQIRWALALAVIIAGLLIYFNTKQPFTVLSSEGQVFIQKAEQTQPIRNDEKIFQNQIITTGQDSECYLSFGKNIIYMGNNTQVLVEKLNKRVMGYIVKLDIKRGLFLSNINDKKSISKMIVKAGNTTAHVKGTIFMVDRTETGKQTIAVLKGKVAIQKNSREYSILSRKKLIIEGQHNVLEEPFDYHDESKFSKILRFNLYFSPEWRQELVNYEGIRIVEDEQDFYVIDKKGKVLSLDKNTGHINWKVKLGPEIKASPVMHEQCLYITSSDGYIYCVSEGEIKWRKKLGPFVYSSPVIHNDKLYLANTRGIIYAVDLDTKQILWQQKLDSGIFSSPAIQNNKLYVGSMSGILYSLNLSNGSIIWEKKLDARIIDNTAVFYEDTLFIGTASGKIYNISSADGKLQWMRKLKGEINTSLILKENIIYVKSENVYAFHVNGNILWSRRVNPDDNIYFLKDKILVESNNKMSYINIKEGQVENYYTKSPGMNIISFNNRVFTYNQKYINFIN